jgi:phosphatidylethanolamine-binding protein (PEBP) family uncharacterized protein
MPRSLQAISSAALLATLALTGCGTGTVSTQKQQAVIPFGSPVISGKNVIPVKYTCDGKDIAPPLEWGQVPAGTKEVALFLLGLTPTPSGGSAIAVDWAVAGVDANLHRLPAGHLPAGTNVGANADGSKRYSLCPAKGSRKTYAFAIYAVPKSARKLLGPFKGLQLFGELASTNSPSISPASGQFAVAYKRK